MQFRRPQFRSTSSLLFFFFFSSRRRHTRLQGDWSSDVCSSDLRSFRERITTLESEILPLETRLKELETAMSSAETYKEPGMARKLGEERKSVEVELAHLYDAWDEATSELQRAEAQLFR